MRASLLIPLIFLICGICQSPQLSSPKILPSFLDGQQSAPYTNANAIPDTQKEAAPSFFARLFRKTPPRHNVAIIVDTTSSMNTNDRGGECDKQRLTCELTGVQTLLSKLTPCKASKSPCGEATNGNVANAIDKVSLFTFPNVTIDTAMNDFNCTGKNPMVNRYSFPSPGASKYAPPSLPVTTLTYQIVSYSSDYRTSNSAPALNSDSDIVKAIGGKTGCPSMRAIGGESTYFAGAIYAAQASLIAERAVRPGSQNVMILITDGDAASRPNQMQPGTTSSGMYPSWSNQCGQAITAAQDATTAGTKVYAVAYGARLTGCSTDVSGTYKGYSACQTMEAIASSPAYFFSNYALGLPGSTCVSLSHPATNLNQILAEIANSIKPSRSLPKKRSGRA
jgi:von Willebrand factor type A domain